MSIYGNAVRKPITTLMIFIAILVLGSYSLYNLPVNLYPDIEYPAISVLTTYRGANPQEIESNVTDPLERSLNSVSELKDMTSVSRDNTSVVTLEFEFDTDLNEAANEIRDAVGLAEDQLPEDVDDPVIFKFDASMMPILMFAVTADQSYEGIEKLLDDRVVNPLKRVEGVGSVNLSGTPNREIEVEVNPRKLEAHSLTVEQLGNILRSENLNLSAGNIKMGQMDYPIRTEGEFEETYQIKNIPIGSFRGQTMYLEDVAAVNDSIGEMTVDEKINGKSGVRMMVRKQSEANTVNVADGVNERLEELKKNLPEDVEIQTIFDSSEFINDSINNLSQTVLYAFIFVILVVLFFLGRWRATFIIALTIPIALIVSFIYLYLTDNTINLISLSALAVAIGMVVDDAIVVLENITRHIERGSSPREAATYATNEVWLAVIVTTLTVVVIFLPMTLIGGLTGVLFRQLGWIVTITVVTSTVAAISLTPMLSSKLLHLKKREGKPGQFSYDNSIRPMLTRLDNWYGRVLHWSLHNKWMVIGVSFGIFLASILLMNRVGTEFIPEADEDRLSMTVELIPGTRLEKSVEVARKIDTIIYTSFPEIDVLSTSTGSPDDGGMAAIFQSGGSNTINYQMHLLPAEQRDRSVWQVAEDIRQELRNIAEVRSFNVSTGGGGMQETNNVNVEIYGFDLDETTFLANELSDKIEALPGARDVDISREQAKPELKFDPDRDKMSKLGLNTATVATALNNRINGMTATRFREAGEEYDIIIRYQEEYRNSISDIEDIRLQNSEGKNILVSDIGEVREFYSPPNIEHKNRERVVTISSKPYNTSLGELANDIQSIIDDSDIPEDVMIEVGGGYEDQQEAFQTLALLVIVGLILVYIVMASQFESFKMPFIIMFSLPFAFTGVILALYITDTTLSVIAGVGAVMLIGIVVKNAIVLVDYINLMRDRGYELDEAIIISGKTRLRPVLMTAFTTALALLPMALGIGEGSEIWMPMGVSVIGGLVFSTIVTMVLVPIIYRIFAVRAERAKKEKVRSQFTFMDM
ncbi:MAG: efflux RND transporter permease subunit [Bacteroidales bacterium]